MTAESRNSGTSRNGARQWQANAFPGIRASDKHISMVTHRHSNRGNGYFYLVSLEVTIKLTSLILTAKHNLCYWMRHKPLTTFDFSKLQ
jgi:hypothetical protein